MSMRFAVHLLLVDTNVTLCPFPDTEGLLSMDRARSWSMGSSSVVSVVFISSCWLYVLLHA